MVYIHETITSHVLILSFFYCMFFFCSFYPLTLLYLLIYFLCGMQFLSFFPLIRDLMLSGYFYSFPIFFCLYHFSDLPHFHTSFVILNRFVMVIFQLYSGPIFFIFMFIGLSFSPILLMTHKLLIVVFVQVTKEAHKHLYFINPTLLRY